MKNFLKRILPTKVFIFIRDIFYPEKINILEGRLNNLFVTHYQNLMSDNLSQRIAFRNAEFKIYSKHGCDGILAYVFSKIGVTNRTFVEMGIEDGRECNTANLSRNFGWQGLMIDANEKWVQSARDFYNGFNVQVVQSFVTAENINKTITDGAIRREIDLLSIDIDGNDYWVWEAITVVNPRVVVIEYNASLGLHPLTKKYDATQRFNPKQNHPLYFGASLTALTKLAKEKKYILVACDTHGHDAFFVKEDVAKNKFIELSPDEVFYPNPFVLRKFGSAHEQFEQIKHLDFEEI